MDLDLKRPRDLSEILSACFSLYGKHFAVFATIALVVVVPIDVITIGVVDGQLLDFDEDTIGGGPAYTLCYYLLATPLITAGHVSAVMQIGAGEQPSIARSLRRAGATLLPVMAGIVLLTIGSAICAIALIIPGIYVYVRWFVTAQSIVVEDLGPIDGMKYSWDLVHENWWRVFGITIVVGLLASVMAAILAIPIGAVGAIVESGPLIVFAMIVADTIVLSFAALAGTILFFDLKARAFPAPIALPDHPPPDPLDRPEAPVL